MKEIREIIKWYLTQSYDAGVMNLDIPHDEKVEELYHELSALIPSQEEQVKEILEEALLNGAWSDTNMKSLENCKTLAKAICSLPGRTR